MMTRCAARGALSACLCVLVARVPLAVFRAR
jgi:hypothetical protein